MAIDHRPMAATSGEIAKRLKRTRLALGFEKQADFAREIGIEKTLYNPFEKPNSGRRITLKIRDRFGVSPDWIYCGDQSFLPLKLHQLIEKAREV